VSRVAILPRNTTRQAQSPLYGNISRLLHRATGTVIVLFVLVHAVVQAVRHAPMLSAWNAPWLEPLQHQAWIHGILYFSIVFHTLYGLRLLAGDLGMRVPYRQTLWVAGLAGLLFLLRELARYAGY
jgi:succinate dehydrogenase/fumarate reductase cytochrome b subunit